MRLWTVTFHCNEFTGTFGEIERGLRVSGRWSVLIPAFMVMPRSCRMSLCMYQNYTLTGLRVMRHQVANLLLNG